jgi:PAS domain S-box-containing protein
LPDKRNTPLDPAIFRLMVEQTRDYAMFVLDLGGHVMSWNPGAEAIKGYKAEEIVGRHFSTFYSPEAVEKGWPQFELAEATRTGRFEDEGWRYRKDGSRFWASVVITALRNDKAKPIGFAKITRDLSERQRQNEALRQSEEFSRLLVEGVVDYAIFMLTPEGIVSSWNAGAERIKGYRREEIVGKHFSHFYTPEDRAARKPEIELETAERIGRAEDQGWRVKKNGELFWARVVVSALHDSEGRLVGFAKVTQDRTEERHVKNLEQAARNVNEFIATLAHELRNPLAPIRSAVQVMAKLPPGDKAFETMRQMVDRQSMHLTRIVEDMVDVSRITRGVLSVERVDMDLLEAVRRSVETAIPQIEAGRHKLDLDLPSRPIRVRGDINRLTQLLTNLLNNAARYTPDGGSIDVIATAEQGYGVVRIRDTGRGIAPDQIDSIFDMFVQGRTALQRVGAGLGIGLALARRLAELHDGSLTASSEGEGKGSEFVFRMPLLEAKRAAGETAASDEDVESGGPSQRVLIVDDNVDAAATLDMLLRSLGHRTVVAHDGQAALDAAAAFHPDVVLLDIGLPGMDGYQVARRMREATAGHPFRIVAITGWGQADDRAKTREAGFDLHLVKPVELTDIYRALSDDSNGARH